VPSVHRASLEALSKRKREIVKKTYNSLRGRTKVLTRQSNAEAASELDGFYALDLWRRGEMMLLFTSHYIRSRRATVPRWVTQGLPNWASSTTMLRCWREVAVLKACCLLCNAAQGSAAPTQLPAVLSWPPPTKCQQSSCTFCSYAAASQETCCEQVTSQLAAQVCHYTHTPHCGAAPACDTSGLEMTGLPATSGPSIGLLG
jgi:hypothetical protein